MKHRVMYQSEFGNLGYCRGEGKQKNKVQSKAKAEKDPVNKAGNSAIRIGMDIIEPDFAGLTWEQWKDTHTEVSMAMSLCALMYTLMHVTACMFRQVHRHFDCWHMCRM